MFMQNLMGEVAEEKEHNDDDDDGREMRMDGMSAC